MTLEESQREGLFTAVLDLLPGKNRTNAIVGLMSYQL
jgi:hypothetical protein